jgi:hypothetical protein
MNWGPIINSFVSGIAIPEAAPPNRGIKNKRFLIFRGLMMKKTIFLFLMLMLILAACGGDGAVATAVSTTTISSTDSPRITADYNDALPVQSQLAVGMLQLEETDLAVDEAEATELLPLWRALQSLSNSDTTAEAEITAVLNQIQNTMSPEQISAIAELKLTQESLTALIEDGTLVLGRGGGEGNSDDSTGEFGPPGGLPPDALGGGPGDGPGGGTGGGFGAGRGQANLSEDDLATRQAARESGDFSGFQNQALTMAVVRLLEEKTGVESELPADPFAAMWNILAEATSLTTEEIRTQMADGVTPAELIEANGGDVEAVKADLIVSLQDSPMAQQQDLEEFVTNMLTNAGGDG